MSGAPEELKNKKMWRKALSLLLAVLILFSFSCCADAVVGSALFLYLAATSDDRANKDEVIKFVCENETELLEAVESGDFSAFEDQGIIKEIDTNDTVVDFYCGGAGMGAGTIYVGFYYTADDDMNALWCAPPSGSSLTATGDGYEWQEPNGDNRYYTEHICGNFYYYEASF